jgi:hypothetical protein
MKKITLLAVVLIAASFASCKKVYTCTCTGTYSYSGGTYTDVYSTGTKVKKSTAETWCTGLQSSGEACTLSK